MKTPTGLYRPADADAAHAAWKANCGPCAMAALLGRPVTGLRLFFRSYPGRPWTNPTQMREALRAAEVRHAHAFLRGTEFPVRGLAFIQFTGPWTKPGAPVAAAYRHTHWIATVAQFVYDVNADGWLTRAEWKFEILPLLLAHTPGADGWYVRTGIEVLT